MSASTSTSAKSTASQVDHASLVLPVGLRAIVTAAVMLATMMEILDSTIVNVALPDMMGNLGATLDQIGWVATGYIMANVVILPLTAWLSDYFGRKKYLAYSVVIFTIASFGCGISHSLGELILWRVLQGAGGAAFISTAQATLMEIYPSHQRGFAQAIFGMGVILAPTFGPVLGGVLTQKYSWPWVFFVNVPVGVTALLLILAFVPDSGLSRGRRKADFVGIGLLAIGLGCLQALLEQGEHYDWFSNSSMRELALGAVIGLAVFLWWELRSANEHPAVNLRVLRFRNLAVACAYAFVFSFVLFGVVFILPLFLQNVQSFPPMEAGIILIPSGVAAGCMMPVVGQLSNRIDRRILLGVGMLITAGSVYLFRSILAPQTPADSFVLPLILRGTGAGLQFVPLSLLALDTINPKYLGDSSGIYNLFRQLGKSFGVAFIVTLIDQRERYHFARMAPNINAYNSQVQQFLQQMQQGFTARGMTGDAAHLAPYGMVTRMIQQQAAVQTYIDVFYLLTIMCLLSLGLVFLFKKDKGHRAPAH
jgi:DHA2 family multidrug resistance protein